MVSPMPPTRSSTMLDYLIALYHAANDCHSGQWSKGYLLLCHASRYLRQWYQIDTHNYFGRGMLDYPRTANQERLYTAIILEYGDSM